MFRIITECLQQQNDPLFQSPYFSMWCDNRNCGGVIAGPARFESNDAVLASQAEFVAAARRTGWTVGLDGQLCPEHSRVMVEAVQAAEERRREGQKLVKPVSNLDGLKYDGKLRSVGMGLKVPGGGKFN